jgi:hypothetical protein
MADGEIILIRGLLARKIVASDTNGDEFAVLTAPAGLLDLVTYAKIHVDVPIHFGSPGPVSAARHTFLEGIMDVVIAPAYAQSPTEERRKAAEADKYFDILATKAFGAEAVAKLKSSPMSQVTAGKIVDAAMGSSAAAYIEFIASTGVSHSGSAVIVPCTRTDVHLKAEVGASANGFGQSIGDVQKTIFTKDYARVVPSENQLCKSL